VSAGLATLGERIVEGLAKELLTLSKRNHGSIRASGTDCKADIGRVG
jgi:hypothetical protein